MDASETVCDKSDTNLKDTKESINNASDEVDAGSSNDNQSIKCKDRNIVSKDRKLTYKLIEKYCLQDYFATLYSVSKTSSQFY